jgi:hypothetical protein
MVLKFTTPNGFKWYGPPYTKAEDDEFYRRVGSVSAVYHGGDAEKQENSPDSKGEIPIERANQR